MPGYQPNYTGLPFDKVKAKSLLLSVYPDVSQVPSITFSYPSSQVSQNEAAALQQMWQNALGIQVKLNPVELNAYNQETANHLIQFGFTQWGADFPDPYDWLTLNLYSTAPNNNGNWNNHQFDQTVTQAEQTTGDARIALYNQAEQIAITDVGWMPIDHEATAAIIPSWVHGVTLNGEGLYFGDWSGVYLITALNLWGEHSEEYSEIPSGRIPHCAPIALRWLYDIFSGTMAVSLAISGRYNRRRLVAAAVGTSNTMKPGRVIWAAMGP